MSSIPTRVLCTQSTENNGDPIKAIDFSGSPPTLSFLDYSTEDGFEQEPAVTMIWRETVACGELDRNEEMDAEARLGHAQY